MSRRPALGLLIGLLLAALPAAAEAGHRVRKGETFATIARDKFGDPELGSLIALHNDLPVDSTPAAGTNLKLPRGRVIRLMIPQRFEALAFRMLGDESLAPVLAALNGHGPADPLQFRERVVIPVLLSYHRSPGEDLATVARRVYGRGGETWPLAMANPDPGDVLRVPVVGFFGETLGAEEQQLVDAARRRLRRPAPLPSSPAPPEIPLETARVEARRDPPAPAPAPENSAELERDAATVPEPVEVSRPPPPVAAPKVPDETAAPRSGASADRTPVPAPPTVLPSPPAIASATIARPVLADPFAWPPLERVRHAYTFGEYHRAQVEAANLLDSGDVPVSLQPQAWLLLGLCRLARDDVDAAVGAFRRARELDPDLDLDPFYYAPKVRDAFGRANPTG